MFNRREFFSTAGAALALPHLAAATPSKDTTYRMPGPFPGRVVEVQHPGSMVQGKAVASAVQAMMRRGIAELTGAPDWVQGWRYFFEPGDVVGIKVNPAGFPLTTSTYEVVLEIIAGLETAGVRRPDMIVFDRFRDQVPLAGYPKILPQGVRWDGAVPTPDPLQLGLEGYDRDVYFEMALVHPKANPEDPASRRSHVAEIVTRRVNKLVCIPVLKDHAAAGVTLALKNMSHGFVNNVPRSHPSPSANATGTFIPGVCALPVIRSKVVLQVLDGLKGVFDRGPNTMDLGDIWEKKTIWMATDPVAMDHIGREVIDAKRVEKGLPKVADALMGKGPAYRQPEHIEIAGLLGLGVYDRQKIDLRQFKLA